MPVRRAARMFAILSSAIAASLVVAACASRAPRATPGDDPHPASPSATGPAAPAPAARDGGVATAEPVAEPPVPDPEPVARLGWVNPARCVSPCAHDPQAHLVRVDDRGEADAEGRHAVHRSIHEPLRELVAAARAAGHGIRIESAYRSYDDQARVFRTTKQVGRAARPGHSEHQLGTAVDFRMPTSAAIGWLADHAPEHGFALSYPDRKQRITGYRPEPWHVRFVGKDLAATMRDNGWSIEELFRARPELGASGSCDDCPLPESRSACGDITASGSCKGTVLTWCYDGALAAVDCAASKQRCGRSRGSSDYDCIARR